MQRTTQPTSNEGMPDSAEDDRISERILTNDNVWGSRRPLSHIRAIVLHQTGSTNVDSPWNWFNGGAGSTQYFVDTDGTILRILPDDSYSGFHIRRGYETSWVNNLNSVGIEFVGMYYGLAGREIYEDITSEQQDAANYLIRRLMRVYNIPRENVFRHPEVQAKNATEAQSVQIP